MKEPKWESCTEEEVWKFVAWHLAKNGIETILVGGAVAAIYNDFAFDELGFEKLIFSNALGNVASRKIKEKTGAQFLRIEPAKFVDPNYKERDLWELTKRRWKEYRHQL